MSLDRYIDREEKPNLCREYLHFSKKLFLQIFSHTRPIKGVYSAYRNLGGWFAVAAPHINRIKLETIFYGLKIQRDAEEVSKDSIKLWHGILSKLESYLRKGKKFEVAISTLMIEDNKVMPPTLFELEHLTQDVVIRSGHVEPRWRSQLRVVRQAQTEKLKQLSMLRGDTLVSITMTAAAVISSRGTVPKDKDWETGMLYAKLFEPLFLFGETKSDKIAATDQARMTVREPAERAVSKHEPQVPKPSSPHVDLKPKSSTGAKKAIPSKKLKPKSTAVTKPKKTVVIKTKLPKTSEYRDLDKRTAGRGGIERITAFIQPNTRERVVKIEGVILPAISRSRLIDGLRTATKIKGLPSGYHRLHLWGPGFGDEAAAGIMYGPSQLNQSTLSYVEGTIREIAKKEKVFLEATATSYSKDPSIRLSRANELVLKSLEYKVSIMRNDTKRHVFSIYFNVGPPKKGGIVSQKVERGPYYNYLDK